jgi:CheY-like chemotaxis protein
VRVRGDATRLAQVLANLLHNAAKYTDSGGEISLSVERQGAEALLRVRDTGMGIPAPMLGRVFELFTQVHRSLDRAQGGLGIGLTLVRRLVEMHGGRVEVHSPGLNQGSEFTIHLPLLADEAAERPSARAGAQKDGPARPRRVLLVDDNKDAAEMLAELLRTEGHEVRLVHDGREVLGEAQSFGPDVVLLDIGLPGLDGYEVARRLRAHPALGALRLVAVTGYGQESDRERTREAGFDHHLVKPVDPPSLAAVVGAAPSVSRS